MASDASYETEPEIAQRIAALQERLERAAVATAALLDQAKREATGVPDEAVPVGGSDEGAPVGGSDEGGPVGGADEGAPVGGSDEGGPRASSGPRRPPPAGWEVPPEGDRSASGLAAELEAFARLIRGLEELIPADLRRALADAFRELLLALRALLDWCAERLAQRRAAEPQIRDIPIL
jgi:hypothetical protein